MTSPPPGRTPSGPARTPRRSTSRSRRGGASPRRHAGRRADEAGPHPVGRHRLLPDHAGVGGPAPARRAGCAGPVQPRPHRRRRRRVGSTRRAGRSSCPAGGSSCPAGGRAVRRGAELSGGGPSCPPAGPSCPAGRGSLPPVGTADRRTGRRSACPPSGGRCRCPWSWGRRPPGSWPPSRRPPARRPTPMLGLKLSPSPWVPSSATLTRVSVPVSRSKRKMSRLALVSSGTRFVAADQNAT